MSNVGEEVKRLRQAKGWTQEQLAVYAGSSQPTVNLLEAGKRNPSAATLEKLASALEVEVVDLFPKPAKRCSLTSTGCSKKRAAPHGAWEEVVGKSFFEDMRAGGGLHHAVGTVARTRAASPRKVRTGIPCGGGRTALLSPRLLGLLRDELNGDQSGFLGILRLSTSLPEGQSGVGHPAAGKPLLGRLRPHKLTDVWNKRFPEKENIVDLEAMRREPRLRRTG